MDEQPSTRVPAWLTIDVMVLVGAAIIIAIGIWIGFEEHLLP